MPTSYASSRALTETHTREKLRPARKPAARPIRGALVSREPCITIQKLVIMVAFTRKSTSEADHRGFAKFRFGRRMAMISQRILYRDGAATPAGSNKKERKEARICCVFISIFKRNRLIALSLSPMVFGENMITAAQETDFFPFSSLSVSPGSRIFFR